MIWIIDASVALRWFLTNESHENADAVLKKMIAQPEKFAVPELFCFEVYSVLCRVFPETGNNVFLSGMIPILNGGLLRYPMTEQLAAEASEFIHRGLTGYDASYAALAKISDGKWITFDKKAHNRISHLDVSHDLSDEMPRDW
ncbi:type II toxin-antitoxin system VapC family toxin [bacterium]|nr:type II toxin-antitoxin system VapC family toxin [bacterium]